MTLAHAKVEAVQTERSLGPEMAPQRAPKRRPDPAVMVSFVALVVLAASMGHVAQRARLATLTYDLHVESLRLAEAKRLNNHLLVEVERARSLQRVEVEARARLGMSSPTQTTWLVMDQPEAESSVEVVEVVERRPGLVAALSGWFERVRSEIKAALPR